MKSLPAFLTALLLAPLAALHAADNSHDSAAPAAKTILTKPGETFVFAVDQAVTDKPQSWTHRAAEAGDYQLGMAWVEVLSGNEVEVTITAGEDIVRSGTVSRSIPARRKWSASPATP